MQRLSIGDIRSSQDLARSGLPLVARHIFVPLSWPLTLVAARLGLSPNGVTALRAAIMLAGVAVIPFSLWGVAVFVFAVVLDHVDGSLCRLQDRATHFGKFLDGLVDIAADVLFLPALGLHVWRGDGAVWALPAATIGGAAISIAFIALYRLPLFELQARVPGAADPNRMLRAVDAHAANLLFDLRYAALAPLLLVGVAEYVAFLAALYLGASAAIVAARISRARLALDIPRKSRSAL